MMHHAHKGADQAAKPKMPKGYLLVAVVYMLGLCMGALDMSIVNPARTVIQNGMGVDDSLGVWILTIYTLAYAASIPVMGKLADRHGRKTIYLLCVSLFGAGSLLCGLAHGTGSFEVLLAARVIQALGGGGIMPVATAEFGTAFPEEMRGMALGVVGMVYGMASIFGPSIGSLILEIFGQNQWQFIFYVNVPVCLAIIAIGIKKLPNNRMDNVLPIDGLGTLILTCMTLSLMYGLKNIDFFNFGSSIQETDVWPFLLAFVLLLPLFILRERKAKDPILNLSYFTNLNVVIAMVAAVISGIVMMGTIFYPQFCENAMLMKSGSGGYFIALLGLGSGVGAMGSGKLIDKYGVKPVLAGGFAGAVVGSLFMAFVACPYPNLVTVCATLLLVGLGLGFTMGAPLNYMMLENTKDEESNSALAALSLVRSIGTAVAPAIMVAFVVHAGVGMQGNLMNALPKEVTVSPLPHAVELDKKMDDLRADENMAEMLKVLDISRLSDYQVISMDMNAADGELNVEVSDKTLAELQNSDVVTIVDACKDMSVEMFGQIKPQLLKKATSGMESGIDAMQQKAQEMGAALAAMGDSPMAGSRGQMQVAYDSLQETIAQLTEAKNALPALFDEAEANYLAAIDSNAADIQRAYQDTLNGGFRGMAIFVAACALVGILVIIPYRKPEKSASKEGQMEVESAA